jgi:hypothetical protein
VSDRGRKLEPNNLKGTKLGSPSWESSPESDLHGELSVELSRCSGLLRAAQGCSGLLRLRIVLYSHSSGLLIYRSGNSHVCSGLEVKIEFGEIKIGVRVRSRAPKVVELR